MAGIKADNGVNTENQVDGLDGEEIIEDDIEISSEGDEDTEEEIDEDEVLVSINGVSPDPDEEEKAGKAPEWVRELRKSHREIVNENRKLKEQLATTTVSEKPAVIGVKPTLESCDYDTDKFEAELTAFHERKQLVEASAAAKQREVEQINIAWQKTLEGYETAKVALKVKDFGDAEDTVKDTLSVVQQGIILQGAKDSALVIYAIGKNPKKANELANIKDPVKFAFAIANLEGQLKVTSRKAPTPEKVIRSGGGTPVSGGNDKALERLRAEAEKTGNYSKVIAYKNQLKKQAK